MTGEMHSSEVTRESYPLHFAIADALGGEVRPFDQYQGPYVSGPKGKFWISAHCERCEYSHEHETGLLVVYNERTGAQAICMNSPADVVSAAIETLED